MKTFEDLKNEEKILLTSEQVEYYARPDCANKGIIIPLKPICEIKEVKPPTSKFYQVGYESFVFETEEDAQKYVDAKSKSLETSNMGRDYDSKDRYVKQQQKVNLEIKSIILYTDSEASELKEIVLQNAQSNKELDVYYKALEKVNSIENYIWDEISQIKFEKSRKEYYGKVYSDYLELANNDEKIAFSFFQKAYENASVSEIDKEIITEFLTSPRAKTEIESI